MCLVTDGTVTGYEPALGLEGGEMLDADPFGREHRDHFAIIRFSEEDDATMNMAVSYWPIHKTGAKRAREPVETFEFKLQ